MENNSKKIGMIGAGSWGSALSFLLANNGHKVTVWSAIEAEIDMLKKTHEQKEKLPGVKLPDSVSFTNDLAEAVKDEDLLVLAVPSPFTRQTAHAMKDLVEDGTLIVSVAKGIEEETLYTLSEVISDEIPGARVTVLCGPSHAEEVGKGMPTLVVAGSESLEDAKLVQDVFMSSVFRVYSSEDWKGMELGGALKNVIALAAGMADGLGCGDNAKAALITRGITEITRLGMACGGKAVTFSGLTGMGDLIVTCASKHSRNRRAGVLIGEGKSYEEAMAEVKQIVEGVYSARAALALAKKHNVEIPIIAEVNKILFEGKDPEESLMTLMMRDRKEED
ncbi:MAG: NAD(P)-dependent glycerol-3-phosphate dehydrogenase [Lachnospiraceae bacterium]|nr:NAD(P)-dependent glycerol-3-phosphate dehydrogenase [Lachnospiraceae bacterium]